MELSWDQALANDPVVFSKDTFDKFTLAPTVKELWALLQSPDVKAEEKEEHKPAGPSSEAKPPKSNAMPAKTSTNNIHGSAGSASNCKNNLNDNKEADRFPDPSIPYPCHSVLTHKEQLAYLQLLKTKNCHTAPQNLIQKVKTEVAEFMKYLQDVSKVCADDYKYTPLAATRYLEEYFKYCLDYMTNYPQVYSIQEITSLAGGKFVSDISFNSEKQLLAMGNIRMVGKKILPEKMQLSVDYETLSAGIPPFKKASQYHMPISSDINAEILSATYEPHVCLAKEAFLQLLNSTAECMEAWELPVWVKESPGTGGSKIKTVYIDPPLLQTQLTWRERNHLIHEESVKLAYKCHGSNPVFFLTSEDYSNIINFPSEEKSSRAVVSFDDTGIDFEVDVTELESFGDSYPISKKTKCHDESKALSKPKLGSGEHTLTEVVLTPKDVPPPPSTLAKEELQEEAAKFDVEDCSMDKSAEEMVSGDSVSNSSAVEECSRSECPPAKQISHSPDNSMNSDEDRLVIDHPSSSPNSTLKLTQVALQSPENLTDNALSSFTEESIDVAMPLSPTSSAKVSKKGSKRSRVSGDCDQLGHILRMQNAMLKSTVVKSPEHLRNQTSDFRPPEPKIHPSPHSLVKPCVSSYLHSKDSLDKEVPALVISQHPAQKKRLLREELLGSAEDEQDFQPPEDSSVFYKLYSLLDVLLMVRSTVDIAQPRTDQSNFRAVPVHMLPKLEYQLCYGAESLTHTEACRLWAEQLLHSSTVSFIGRINAHTSKVVQLQELPADWIQNTTCDFKPAKILNSLHHILKKVIGLQDGRYLLGHKPGEAFVTIYKAIDGTKPSRSVYDLQAVHCGHPVVPIEARVPWVPLDHNHLMPFHLKNNRPPCTFPPRSLPQNKQTGARKRANQGNATTIPAQRSQQSATVPGQNPKRKKKRTKKKQKVMP